MNNARKQSAVFWGAALILGSGLCAATVIRSRAPETLARPLDSIPLELGEFRASRLPPLREDVLGALTPTSYLSRVYEGSGQSVRLFIAYYGQQRAGQTMHSPKNCLPGGGWEIWQQKTVEVPLAGGTATLVNHAAIRKGADRLAVFYWYQTGNRAIASEYEGKLALIQDALTSGRTDASIAIVTVEDTPEGVAAGLRLAGGVIAPLRSCFRS